MSKYKIVYREDKPNEYQDGWYFLYRKDTWWQGWRYVDLSKTPDKLRDIAKRGLSRKKFPYIEEIPLDG